MKRYTGQQALYEAISRSQAKAKRGSVLEKLRPQPPKQGKPVPEEPKPANEPIPTPAEAPQPVSKGSAKSGKGVTRETARPAARETAKPFAKDTVKSTVKERPLQTRVKDDPPKPLVKETLPGPREKPEPAVVGLRPFEKIGRLKPAQPLLRPRPVQLNGRRVEVSVPYYIGIAAGLVVILMILGAFRAGQGRPGGQVRVAPPTKSPVRSMPQNAAQTTTKPTIANRPQPEAPVVAPRVPEPAPTKPQGDHWIVLAQYKNARDFEPVIEHFRTSGIELGVVALDLARQYFTENNLNAALLPSGSGYLLVAKDRYNNPNNPGTDGYEMKQKIIQVGAQYKGKAPSGYESFAPNYFGDAYGMKVK